ncbi:MAG TPA: hypothetical protein HPP87_03290 [Planctomycetes bacterium]|nr:hypothetical protein [Planctomycetota bacterium]HIJ70369.1 hypothetical protein [Planctomycetota bacterium]
MRIVAVILNIICLLYVGGKLVADISDYYFDTAGFYLLLCLCFIINLIALRRSGAGGGFSRQPKEQAAHRKSESSQEDRQS